MGSSRPKGMWSVDLLFGPRFYSWGFCSMNESKSKKSAPLHDGFEWAGAVARVRRGVRSNRGTSHGAAEHADRRLCELQPGRPDQRSDRGRALNQLHRRLSFPSCHFSRPPIPHEPTTLNENGTGAERDTKTEPLPRRISGG